MLTEGARIADFGVRQDRYPVSRAVTAAFGIENLSNDKYGNFHPYPQRSSMAELKFDL